MRPCILWVEDNASDVLLVQQAMREADLDADLIVASNAVAAFQHMDARHPNVLKRNPPDLILVDINLPGINGMVVLNEIRKHRDWKKSPTVVLTSSSNPKELQACREIGAIECITKPATFEGYIQVISQLRRHLPQSGGHPTDPGDKTKRKATKQDLDPKGAITNKVMDELAKPKPQSDIARAG